MEAHGSAGSTVGKFAQAAAGLLPDAVAQNAIDKRGHRPAHRADDAIDPVRRGGTVSISGVYGGEADLLPMMDAVRQADPDADGTVQCAAMDRRPAPLVEDSSDPLGVLDLTTHRVSLAEAPQAYQTFQEKTDGCIKVVLKPSR